MKCPHCGHDQKVKFGMTCGGCGYGFTFNPKNAHTLRLTDGKFLACVRSAGQNDTAWFTENQLYAAFCRQTAPSIWPGLIACISFVLIGIAIMIGGGVLVGMVVVVIGLGILWLSLHRRRNTSPPEFQRLLRHWKDNGKTIDKLIEEPSLHEPPPTWNEPDIYDYGVERILVVERDILVDLFVKNGVHAEQRMLVLAETGYPHYLVDVARRLLEEQPDLPVFLLHDATTHGVQTKERLVASGLLPLQAHSITDLGMFPADFRLLKRTRRFDADDEERALPVDAMLLPFLTTGLGTAMVQEIAFGTLIEEQHRRQAAVGGEYASDFG